MGILDDAIREHLELKRSHGATDDEIRRKEAEAFGAARAEAPAPAAPEPETHPDELEPLEPAPEDPYEVHPGDDLVPDPEQPHVAEHEAPAGAEAGAGMLEPREVQPGPPQGPPRHHHHDEQHPALIDHDHIGGEEHPPEPVFGHAAETPAAPPVEEPPVEESPVGDDEDVLEETPEFLQDAPEHDRLWFEQRPPRDFDFGE